MAENSKIQWTDATWNPWRGCTKVSAGCQFCYADTLSKRNPLVLGVWGPQGTRVVASEAKWREPVAWDRAAKAAGERRRVFCASLADVFESWDGPMVGSKGDIVSHDSGDPPWRELGAGKRITMQDIRARLFRLIDDTPHLDWLLLTKRPENIATMLPAMPWKTGLGDLGRGVGKAGVRRNLWLGTSVENQAAADERIPYLLKVPAVVRFLSVEPLLGPIEFSNVTRRADCVQQLGKKALEGIHWIICGGESGPSARPCEVEWIRSVVRQCKAAEVPVFVKQLGSRVSETNFDTEDWNEETGGPGVCLIDGTDGYLRPVLRDKKGGDVSEFPEDLRIREFPNA